MRWYKKSLETLFYCASVSVLLACGGSSVDAEWRAGVFRDAAIYEDRCEVPQRGRIRGSSLEEKLWLRSISDDTYLWYDEIPDQNPAPFSVLEYFDELKTTGLSSSGQPKDKFHFSYDTEEWERLSQSGISFRYGMQLAIDNGTPRTIVIAYTEPNSPATNANLTRGARILAVDGVDVTANTPSAIASLNNGLFPDQAGETHQFVVQDLDAGTPREISLVSAQVTSDPVQNVGVTEVAGSTVGYMLFNDHIATAQRELVDAIQFLSAQGIDELVLDMRYNGGGFLTIAAELAYMIAGPAQTAGKTFELPQFNDKHPNINPVTGEQIRAIEFRPETTGFSLPAGLALPALGLSRVYVLTSSSTCSASEAIINGLLGIDVDVIQIGTTTCGKPYGFYGMENCGRTYFTIQFRGVNDKNFGDFSDGFTPANGAALSETLLAGCEVDDDLTRELGDPNEARFAAALHYIETGSCPTANVNAGSLKADSFKTERFSNGDPVLLNVSPWRQNRIMGEP